MKVGDLEQFPFENFDSFRAACAVGAASIGVDSQFGIEWLLAKPGFGSKLISYALMAAPFGFIVYSLIYFFRYNAWLLLASPLFLFAYLLTHPGMVAIRNLLSPLFSLVSFLIFSITLYLLWHGQYPGLTRLFLCTLTIGLCNYLLGRRMIKAFIRETCADEDFLCRVWSHGLANIISADGNMFRYRPPAGEKENVG
jgi:hypothetical protein